MVQIRHRGTVSETRGELFRDIKVPLVENKELKEELVGQSEKNNEAELENLDDELAILETVVEMMELSSCTKEAKEMQRTMSTIGMDTIQNRRVEGKRDDVKVLVEHVMEVSKNISI